MGGGGWGGGGATGRRHLTAHPSSAGSGSAASGRLADGHPTGRNERGRERVREGRGAAFEGETLTLSGSHTRPPAVGSWEEAGRRRGRRGGSEDSRRRRIDAGGGRGGWGCGRGKVGTARGGVGCLPYPSVRHLRGGGPDSAPPDPCKSARSERGVLQSTGNERVREHYRERRGSGHHRIRATFERCSKSDNILIYRRNLP